MPKIVDHDERRAHIVEAVTELIIREGFDAVTMRAVAKEAGYAHGAISRYFPDKQHLLTAAFLHVFETSHEGSLEATNHLRGLNALHHLIEGLLPYPGASARATRVVLTFWERASQDPSLYAIHATNIARRRALIRELLEQARDDDELFHHIDLDEAVNRVNAHTAGWQMLGLLVPESTTRASLDASVDAIIRSLGEARK